MPYQVFGARSGALAVIRAWIRSAIERSAGGISAIFASRSLSPSCLASRDLDSAFSSRARSRIAAFSSAVNPGVRLVVVCVLMAGSSLRIRWNDLILGRRPRDGFSETARLRGHPPSPWPGGRQLEEVGR